MLMRPGIQWRTECPVLSDGLNLPCVCLADQCLFECEQGPSTVTLWSSVITRMTKGHLASSFQVDRHFFNSACEREG